jgi:uncharacterized protein YegL
MKRLPDLARKCARTHTSEDIVEHMEEECIELLLAILIGVNVNQASVARVLSKFNVDAGFDQYVEMKDASKESLAKMAQFVSKSISAQSQSLGTGGASATLASGF